MCLKLFSEKSFLEGQECYYKMFTIADLAYQNKMKNKKWLDLNMRPLHWVKYFIKKKNGVPYSYQKRVIELQSVCVFDLTPIAN